MQVDLEDTRQRVTMPETITKTSNNKGITMFDKELCFADLGDPNTYAVVPTSHGPVVLKECPESSAFLNYLIALTEGESVAEAEAWAEFLLAIAAGIAHRIASKG
jgi:hypothetical protein